jgi:hypothetical protein
MDQKSYSEWWALHVRAARGEGLTEEERITHEAGLKQLQQEEVLDGDLTALRLARQRLRALEGEQIELRAQQRELDQKISALEAALNERTRSFGQP